MCEVISCDSGYHEDSDACVSNIRSCTISNGEGQETYNTVSRAWGACEVVSCDSGYHEESGACVSDIRSCTISNGEGQETYNTVSRAWGACEVVSCDSGYHEESGACVSDIRSCTISNGEGQETYNTVSRAWGACEVVSCDSSYHEESGACVSDIRSCTISNGEGQETYNTVSRTWGACEVVSCDSSYHEESGACVSNTRSCTISNGEGQETYNTVSQTWGSCELINCDSGYHEESGACVSSTRSCTVANGEGQETYNTVSNTWGACEVLSCHSGYHEDSGDCVSDTRNCTISNGEGQETYNTTSNTWGSCEVISCDSGYHEESNLCLSNRGYCLVPNGSGVRDYDVSSNSWGMCMVTNCYLGFHQEGNSCVSNTRSCAISNGEGTQYYDFVSRAWGACLVTSCDSGFHQELHLCVSDTRNCEVSHGSGTQVYDTTFLFWGLCTSLSCDEGYHEESGACVSSTRSCTIFNGEGTQTYNLENSSWSDCSFVGCYNGYHEESGTCVSSERPCTTLSLEDGLEVYDPTTSAWQACEAFPSCSDDEHLEGLLCVSNARICEFENGEGSQSWQTDSYGRCLLSSCSEGYEEDLGLCVTASDSDPLSYKAWHLNYEDYNSHHSDLSPYTFDINVRSVYQKGITGKGVVVAVSDSGVELTHEDLEENHKPGISKNFLADPPYTGEAVVDPSDPSSHGTAVTGIIAATALNSKGAYGVAFDAQFGGFNFLDSEQNLAQELEQMKGPFHIFNYSYGDATLFNYNEIASNASSKAAIISQMKETTENGAVYVKASGNERIDFFDFLPPLFIFGYYGNNNFSEIHSYPYFIVVGAIERSGSYSEYSTPGSNLWVVAPGSDIFSIDFMGCHWGDNTTLSESDPLCSYRAFRGTSAAAPIVSGVIALLYEANPELTWRDIKHILASTAHHESLLPPPRDHPGGSDFELTDHDYEQGWVTNAAGFTFSNQYGFGLVDAARAVEMAESYDVELGTFEETVDDTGAWRYGSEVLNLSIPDEDAQGVSSELCVDQNLVIEKVQIRLTLTHPFVSDLGVELTSPSGTKSIILNINSGVEIGGITGFNDFLFGTNAFYGETSYGDTATEETSCGVWTLKVIDGGVADEGTLKGWKINIQGRQVSD